MEDPNFYWPEDVSNPFMYPNIGWPDWSPVAIEPSDDEFLQLPLDGLSAVFSDCRSPSNNAPSAALEQNRKQRPQPAAEDEAPWFKRPRSSNISFRQPSHSSGSSSPALAADAEPDPEAMAQIKEIIYRAAAFRPVSFLPEETTERLPQRKNVRISSDPQTAAARLRRERVSVRIRALQKLVPGGTKMDTASMLDEAANYLKFLKEQVKALENSAGRGRTTESGGRIIFPSPVPYSLFSYMQNYYDLDHVPVPLS